MPGASDQANFQERVQVAVMRAPPKENAKHVREGPVEVWVQEKPQEKLKEEEV